MKESKKGDEHKAKKAFTLLPPRCDDKNQNALCKDGDVSLRAPEKNGRVSTLFVHRAKRILD